MGATAGYLAILQIGGTPTTITGIKSVDVKISTDIYDITALSDGVWKKKLGGLADYSLAFSGNLDMTDAEQAVLQAAIITNPGTQVQWVIAPKGTTTGMPKYSGTALVKAESIKFAVNAEEQVQFDLEGTGALVVGTFA
jgi:predicted secreted protein